jgi:hypothetical protein
MLNHKNLMFLSAVLPIPGPSREASKPSAIPSHRSSQGSCGLGPLLSEQFRELETRFFSSQ